MAQLKSLFKDTAVYGLSSIIGRFLNYLLVPLYTRVLVASGGGYGIVTNLYAYVALLLVILTFGMETTFFRFANKEGEKSDTVFSTAFMSVTVFSLTFFLLLALLADPVSVWLKYPDHKDYILMMGLVVTLDAIQAIPFSYLRYTGKALKFASLKLLFIFLNIGLNILFFLYLGERDVFYIFLLNLVCTGIITFFFVPEFLRIEWHFDLSLFKRMLSYSWPILILGIAGILNQTADKMLFPHIYPDVSKGVVELGIYGACVKVAMIMAMITQAFRYAYEPFVFAQSRNRDKNETYAMGMKYFVIFTLLAFICVMGWLPVLKYLVGSDYHEGLYVIPIVMAAEIMMGIYFNLSFWYKLIDKTIYGAIFSIAGCIVLIGINVVFIPRFSYMACAWGGFAGYGTAMLLSYFVGQRKYPINYPIKSMAVYLLMTVFFYVLIVLEPEEWNVVLRLSLNTLMIIAFLAHIYWHELRRR